MIEISIIMPIYNAEQFLHRSINSIINQSFKNWELILVNDGSTDNSAEICNSYVIKDNRIKVINKKNEGVAMARQSGINMAEGKYSIHCDADDWMEPFMLESMYNCAQTHNSDIVISDYYINTYTFQEIKKQEPTSLDSNNVLLDIFNNKLLGSLWNKLIRTNLYKIFDAKFFNGINHCEDLLILVQILQHKNLMISYYPQALYHYYNNQSSITNNFTRETYEVRLKFKKKLQDILILPNANIINDQVSFSIFTEAIIHKVLLPEEIRTGLKIYKNQIKIIKGIRWKIGFYLFRLRMYRIGYKFIHY